MTSSFKKWIQLIFLACGILAWVLLRELTTLLFGAVGFTRLNWIVAPSDIAGLAMGAMLFFLLLRWEKASLYLGEVLGELTKVTWPKRKETLLSTGVVSILIGIATLCILLFDSVWVWVAEKFLY